MLWLMLSVGCSSPCLMCPTGRPVDMTEALDLVEGVYEGDFAGTVVDTASPDRQGVHFEPCAIADLPFELTVEVEGPDVCRRYRREYERTSCTHAHTAHFPLYWELAIDGEPEATLASDVNLVSMEDGLVEAMAGGVTVSSTGFPHQTMDLIMEGGPLLEDVTLAGLQWDRRLSEDEAELIVWERCLLSLD